MAVAPELSRWRTFMSNPVFDRIEANHVQENEIPENPTYL